MLLVEVNMITHRKSKNNIIYNIVILYLLHININKYR